jgi:hypothetical protein
LRVRRGGAVSSLAAIVRIAVATLLETGAILMRPQMEEAPLA